MTAIKASDVDRFIARPDPGLPIVLVFGPDAGLVRERVDALVRASVDDPNDPFALARIEGEELAGNPARLGGGGHTGPPVCGPPAGAGWGGGGRRRTRCGCPGPAARCWLRPASATSPPR